jgi:hypothetical protein
MMASYQPKLESLRAMAGVWQVKEALMDRIGEGYYLGGDFEGRRERIYYYMVWGDPELGRFFAGFNRYGQQEVPFSKNRCEPMGVYRSLREALEACENHASLRLRKRVDFEVPAGLAASETTACAFAGPVYF